jgi:hypothetical protein
MNPIREGTPLPGEGGVRPDLVTIRFPTRNHRTSRDLKLWQSDRIGNRTSVVRLDGELHFDSATRLAIERNGGAAFNGRPCDWLQLVTKAGGLKTWESEPCHCRKSSQGKRHFRRRRSICVLRDGRGIRFNVDSPARRISLPSVDDGLRIRRSAKWKMPIDRSWAGEEEATCQWKPPGS